MRVTTRSNQILQAREQEREEREEGSNKKRVLHAYLIRRRRSHKK